ncbi:MAG: ABC transporter substrate-binding protein [Spirochaetaceae bacterium]|jgi:putative ABC transport system substrate-binding protein|nr:ABC transporter substrate-binding protein [Spirochaetaceae bacterium]
MKKTVIGAAMILAAAALFARGVDDTSGRPRVGIAKFVSHEALDACERGITDALAQRGINAVIDYQNANADANTAAQIANRFRTERVDVAVGIATPIAVALANAITDRPVVFAAVTDPVGARLVSSLDRGERNVTGLSDAIPTVEHIALFKQVANIRTLGYIYTGSEANSVSALALVEEGCRRSGITLVTQAITSSAELRQAAEAIVGRVDGVYLTTDNTVYSAFPALLQVFNAAKKPVFSGDVTAALGGGALIASGFNYYKAGVATGNLVADIIEGKNPVEIPVRFLTDPSESDLLIDLDQARNCGITVPQNLQNQANYIFQNGRLTTR